MHIVRLNLKSYLVTLRHEYVFYKHISLQGLGSEYWLKICLLYAYSMGQSF